MLFRSLIFLFGKGIIQPIKVGKANGEERRGEKMSHFYFFSRLSSYLEDLYYEWNGGRHGKRPHIFLTNLIKIFFFPKSLI